MDSYLTRRRLLRGMAVAPVLGALRLGRAAGAPAGFRPLFDGRTMAGWRAISRVPVPDYPGAPEPDKNSEAYKRTLTTKGSWVIKDGVITGQQDPVGSRLGAYLITEKTFGDFELQLDVNPDWSVDSGIMIRATPIGGQGFQVHMDYRYRGSVGTFYGNGLGPFRARQYAYQAKFDAKGNAIGLEPCENPEAEAERKRLAWAAPPDTFFKVWKFGDWNTIRARCVGKYPRITSWINGTKIAELDAGALQAEHYDRDAVAQLLGRKGHIALEVHDSGDDLWLGKERWLPGHVCRWRNIYIKELD
jgi:hypothetical protein